MSKSRVTGRWLSQPVISCPPGVNARIPRLLQWPSEEGMHEVVAWVWGSVRHGNAIQKYTWALSVLIRTLLPEGMACGRANLEASCLLLHVVMACTLVELHRAIQRRKPERWACRVARVLSVGWFRPTQDLDTSLVVFLRGTFLKVDLCMVSCQKKCCIGKASVSRTHSPGLAARLTEHFRSLYRPGLKDAQRRRFLGRGS